MTSGITHTTAGRKLTQAEYEADNAHAIGSMLPDVADTYDLGSASLEYKNLYLGTSGSIYFGLAQEFNLKHILAEYTIGGGDLADLNVNYIRLSHGTQKSAFSLWNTDKPPLCPGTSVEYALSIYGDLLIGDIWNFSTTAYSIARRQVAITDGGTNSWATTLYSNKDGSKDDTGGSLISLVPDEAGAVNSGIVNIVAYGQGSGAVANTIRFFTRSGVDTITERMAISSSFITAKRNINADGYYIAADSFTGSTSVPAMRLFPKTLTTTPALYIYSGNANGDAWLQRVSMTGHATEATWAWSGLVHTGIKLGGALNANSQNITGLNSLFVAEQAAADADVEGSGQFWVKTATPNTPYFTDDAGTDHAIITGATATKHEFHLPFEDPTGAVGNWDVIEINAAQDTHFTFQIPENFESVVNAKVIMIPDATETIQWDINVSVSAAGEAHDNDDRSAVDQTLAVTADQLTEVDISGQLTGLAAGDYVGIDFLSDTANLRIIGFEFDYL